MSHIVSIVLSLPEVGITVVSFVSCYNDAHGTLMQAQWYIVAHCYLSPGSLSYIRLCCQFAFVVMRTLL